MTGLFLAFAILGFGLLIAGLFFDFLDGIFDALDLGGGGVVSAPVIGAFLGAFGLGGLAFDAMSGGNLAVGLVGAVAAGLGFGWIAFRLSSAFMHMATDATPTSRDLEGLIGRVVTPIAAGGSGEILVRLGGQQLKLTARSSREVPLGASVIVLEVLSSSSVRVEPESSFWDRELGEESP